MDVMILMVSPTSYVSASFDAKEGKDQKAKWMK
jgi:hypothetical protein